jgi:hypothetical protein
MKKIFIVFLVFMLFFGGTSINEVEGYIPVYIPKDQTKVIKTLPPQDVATQGKIYVKDSYIFIGDVNLGIHVVDNTDPRNPQKIAFIQIYGNHDIAIKENILYADNLEDLVALNISDINNPTLVKHIQDVYKEPNQFYPENLPFYTYFECADPDKGYVIGWIPGMIKNPECYTSY